MLQIAEDDYFSFYHCLRTQAPIFSYNYANHIAVCCWINAKEYPDYRTLYPETLELEGERIIEEKRPRYLLVCDSENMQKKAAMFLVWKKNAALRNGARKRHQPLSGEKADEDAYPVMLEIDFSACREKEDTMQWNTALSKMDQWNDVFFRGLGSGKPVREISGLILSERECGCYVGVSRELYRESWIQQLVYEGEYDVIFLPEEGEGYYEQLAVKLLLEPAIRYYICRHPGVGQIEYGELQEENPYLGVLGDKDDNIYAAVRLLRQKRGTAFQETDIARLFEMTRDHNCNMLTLLQERAPRDARELRDKVGLEPLKDLAKRRIALWQGARRNPLLRCQSMHYLFVGNPGSGKTMSASLLHETLASKGCVAGNFVVATRKDIVASYVGQTAPKVAELFRRAAGGTLFVDEAGFFLQEGCGGYIHEALKEFVRYMEIRRDVSVIFAVYPGEKEAFLELDAGLSSRLAQVVDFPDYTVEQLCQIGREMWAEQGYRPGEGTEKLLAGILRKKRGQKSDGFGNAREVRRLVELSIQEAELRRQEEIEGKIEGSAASEEAENTIRQRDLREAAELVDNSGFAKKPLGFRIESAADNERRTRPECEAV